MPKTNEKDAYFFSHDCNARNDPKILALRSVYGAEGYGVYFMLIEILREQPEYKLTVNKYIWNTLAMQMQMQTEKVQEIIEDCCTEFTDGENGEPLLVNDGKYLYSASLLRRMGRVENVSRIRSAAARKRWENQPCKDFEDQAAAEEQSASVEARNAAGDEYASDVQMQSTSCADAEQMQSRGANFPPSPVSPSAPLSSPLSLSPTPPISLPPIIPPVTPLTPFPADAKTRTRQTGAAKTDPFAEFAGEDAELFSALRDFVEMRVKIKKPMTDRAKKLLLTELEKLACDRETQIAILNQSITRCWAGVFALKSDQGYQQPPRGGRPQQASTGDKMDALRDLHDGFSR